MKAVNETQVLNAALRNGRTESTRFRGFKLKKPHGPAHLFAYSKHPVRGIDGGPCYVAGEFVKDRDSQGRPRRLLVRFATFAKRCDALYQALDWFSSRSAGGNGAAGGALSSTYAKNLARRLKHAGLRTSFCAPNPCAAIAHPVVTPVNVNSTPLPEDCVSSKSGASGGVPEVADPGLHQDANTQRGGVPRKHRSGLLARACRAVASTLYRWRGYRAERASCANK